MSVIKEYKSLGNNKSGIGSFGNRLWSINSFEDKIYEQIQIHWKLWLHTIHQVIPQKVLVDSMVDYILLMRKQKQSTNTILTQWKLSIHTYKSPGNFPTGIGGTKRTNYIEPKKEEENIIEKNTPIVWWERKQIVFKERIIIETKLNDKSVKDDHRLWSVQTQWKLLQHMIHQGHIQQV